MTSACDVCTMCGKLVCACSAQSTRGCSSTRTVTLYASFVKLEPEQGHIGYNGTTGRGDSPQHVVLCQSVPFAEVITDDCDPICPYVVVKFRAVYERLFIDWDDDNDILSTHPCGFPEPPKEAGIQRYAELFDCDLFSEMLPDSTLYGTYVERVSFDQIQGIYGAFSRGDATVTYDE